MAGVQWMNGADNSTVDVRPGGPGNKWEVMDQNASVDAPSGGGRAFQTLWGRGEKGGLDVRAVIATGNPEDFTANLSYPLTSDNAVNKKLNCPFTIRARQYCGASRTTMIDFVAPGMIGYHDTRITSKGYDNGLAMGDGQGTDVQRTRALMAPLEETWVDIGHNDISLTTSDVAINRVLKIGADICQGACGLASNEEDSWLAVTDKDTAPTYAGTSAPWLYWTVDRWVTRNAVRIGALLAADALDVVLAGSRVIVFSDTKAPVYAQLADIYNGVVDPLLWATSTGLSETGTNFPKAAVAVDSSTVLAVGAGGRIWLSTDGGLSFTKIYDTGALTSQNLNAIHAQAGGNAFAGGNSGVFIRLAKTPGVAAYTGSLIVVKDASLNTLSSNINSVRTPSKRGDEVYLGTAGGEIWRSRNVNATTIVFQNKTFDRSGLGSIVDMDFTGYMGDSLFVLQAAADSTTRVLRDLSGGNLGNDVKIIGMFTSPSNFKINSIAMANVNMGVTVGEIHETYAFIGELRPI